MAPISSSNGQSSAAPKLVINLKKSSVRMVHQATSHSPSPSKKGSAGSCIGKHNKKDASTKTSLLKKALKNSLRMKTLYQQRSDSKTAEQTTSKCAPSPPIFETCKPNKSPQSDHQEQQKEEEDEDKKNKENGEQKQDVSLQKVNKEPNYEEARAFILLVRETFTSKPIMFDAFMHILKSLYVNPSKTPEAIRETQGRVLGHFQKYPQLAEQFRRQFNVPADLAPAAAAAALP